MKLIVKTITIGVSSKFAKELDYGLKDLGIEPIISDFYETEFMGKEVSKYYVQVQCDCKEEAILLDWLNNVFKHEVAVN